jgi:hypothetical protein
MAGGEIRDRRGEQPKRAKHGHEAQCQSAGECERSDDRGEPVDVRSRLAVADDKERKVGRQQGEAARVDRGENPSGQGEGVRRVEHDQSAGERGEAPT